MTQRRNVGEHLRKLRRRQSLYQKDIGKRLWRSQRWVSDVELNATSLHLEDVESYASALGVDTWVLLGEIFGMPNSSQDSSLGGE